MRTKYFISAAVFALFATPPALAQPAAPASGVANSGIGDIVVTAQRKEESVQRAALAIDAVSGASLVEQGVTNARDITKLVPSLTITNGGGHNTSLFMRGVGNRTNNSYNDPAIAASYDGVYLAHPAALTGTGFFDLERVEVLKGPQGILYGRNATGGAINILPARPKLGVTAGGFDVSFGSYSAVTSSGYVNLPVSDDMAVRVAGTRQVHDGYNRDGTDDGDGWALRGQLLFKPSSDVSLRIGGDYSHSGGRGPGNVYLGNFSPNGAGGYNYTPQTLFDTSEGFGTAAANAYRSTILGAPGFGFLTPINTQTFVDFDYYGLNAELNVTTGIGKLTIIPAYRKTKGSTAFFGPAFNTAVNFVEESQSSIEARLAGKTGMIDYLLGGFYFHDKSFANNEFNQEFVLPIQSYTHKTDSWAAFGQLTAHVSDRFRLIGGARYTHDSKNMDGIINNFITFCSSIPPKTPPASFGAGCAVPSNLPRYPNFLNVPDTFSWLQTNGWISPTATLQPNMQVFQLLNGKGVIQKTYSPVVASRTFTRPTFKASAEFDIAPRSLLYATFETGYRAGGFQLAEGHPNYEPEYLDSMTIGSKNRFFGNRVQLNFEGFYWKYRDQQITYFTVDTSGTLINSNENAGRVTIKGFDIDAIFKVTPTTTLSGKVQYLDTNYDNLHLYTAAPRDNIGCPYTLVTYADGTRYPTSALHAAGTPVLAGGNQVKDFNCSGNQGVFAPKWTVNLGIEQIVPVSSNFELVGRIDTAWRDAQNGGFEFLAFERIPGYWQTDASVTLRHSSGKFSVSAFVYNIENKRRSLFPQQSPSGPAVSAFGAPRTYGLRLTGDF